MRFELEVYDGPDVDADILFSLKSDTAFTTVAVGDELHWQTMRMGDLRVVTSVRHLFWDIKEPVHKTCVYTRLESH